MALSILFGRPGTWLGLKSSQLHEDGFKNRGMNTGPCDKANGWHGFKPHCVREKSLDPARQERARKESLRLMADRIRAQKGLKAIQEVQRERQSGGLAKPVPQRLPANFGNSVYDPKGGFFYLSDKAFDKDPTALLGGRNSRITSARAISVAGEQRYDLSRTTGSSRATAQETNRKREFAGYFAPRRQGLLFVESGQLDQVAKITAGYRGIEIPTEKEISSFSRHGLKKTGASRAVVEIKPEYGSAGYSQEEQARKIRDIATKSNGNFRAVYDNPINRIVGLTQGDVPFNPLTATSTTDARRKNGTVHLVANLDKAGNLIAPSLAEIKEAKSRQIIERLRDYQFNAGVRRTYSFDSAAVISRGASGRQNTSLESVLAANVGSISRTKQVQGQFLSAAYREEDHWGAAADKLEARHIERRRSAEALDTKELAKARNAAAGWSRNLFGEPEAVNGFTKEQVIQHDIVHPITSVAIGKSTKEIQKHFGRPGSLVPEESIVAAMEHLSRGDTFEGSLAAGRRLARVLSREEGDRDYYSSPEFTKKLRDEVRTAYSHPDHNLHMAIVKRANRRSDTTFQGGEDYFQPDGNEKLLTTAQQNQVFRTLTEREKQKTTTTKAASPPPKTDPEDDDDFEMTGLGNFDFF